MCYTNVVSTRWIPIATLILSALVLPAAVDAQSVRVQLGEYGGTVTLVRNESGRYTWNRQPVFDGSIVTSTDGSRYVLTLSGGEWSAGYLPRLVRVSLGASGHAITLRELENGDFWWNGIVEPGLTFTGADGEVYRLSYAEGMWSASLVREVLSVPLGQSGEVAVLTRLETGGYSYDGQVVRSGLRVSDSRGRVYEFVFRNGAWQAVSVAAPPDPPVDPRPDPSPIVRSDRREAYVGVEPTLTTGEDGTRRAVLEVGGAKYSVHELFTEGGVTWAPTFAEQAAERIESILSQIDPLAAAYDNDPSGFRDAVELRWDLAKDALDGLFGDNAEDVFGDLPLTRRRTVDIREVVETLEDVLDALSNFRDFYDAVVDGVFEDAISNASADNAFDAVQSMTRLEFGSTANTRFGAYLRFERDGDGGWQDDLVLLDGDDGFGSFAYSPLEASRRAELPSRGEAYYVGETVAVSPDGGFDAYSGIIELNVRFGSNRVSAQITGLRDDDDDLWRYGFADVDVIKLPSASLDDGEASFEVDSGNAAISYRSLFGSPRPRSLRGDLEGKFVGEGSEAGDSVIGTWSLFESTRRAPLLTGAFGADFDSVPGSMLPVLSDDGEDSATYLGAQPNRRGNIRLGGRDEAGSYLEFSASDLFAEGYAESIGPSLVSVARDGIEQQIELLDLWVEIASSDAERDRRRRDVWDSANEILFEIVFGGKFGARNPLGSTYPDDRRGDPDDDEARSLLLEAARALSRESRFEDALERFGVFYEESDVVTDVNEMFDVLDHEVRVEFRHTDYGRFGVWSRTVGDSAVDGIEYDPDAPAGVFAYSPLEQAIYFNGGSNFPTGGSAYYEGSALAIDDSSTGPRTFEGSVAVTVEWGSRLSSSTLTSVIHDLRTVGGNAVYRYNGLGVDQIVFSNDLSLSVDDGIEFDSSRPSVRIRYLDASRPDTRWDGSASHSGKFVGTSLEGPLGLIGTWELRRSTRSVSLKGAYAADLVP